MILHEGRDEEIGVIVAFLAAKRQRNTGLGAGFFQELGLQLRLEETIRAALVSKQFRDPRAVRDESTSVVGSPLFAILSQISAERLLAPGAIHGGGNRSEC